MWLGIFKHQESCTADDFTSSTTLIKVRRGFLEIKLQQAGYG